MPKFERSRFEGHRKFNTSLNETFYEKYYLINYENLYHIIKINTNLVRFQSKNSQSKPQMPPQVQKSGIV